MTDQVRNVVRNTSAVASAIAVVLSPIPLADEIALLPVYGVMAARIGKTHGLAFGEVPWKPIALTTVSALAARAALNVTVSFIPGVAAVANAVSALTVTQIIGGFVDGACADPSAARPLSFKEIAGKLRDAIALRTNRRRAPASAA